MTEKGLMQWDRLARLSEHLLDDIEVGSGDDGTWYVSRDIEAALLRRTVQGSEPQIVVGEAGHGKSTLLWSLHRALQEQGFDPLLVSATWLHPGDDGIRTTSTAEIISAITGRPGAILLLDTADLMLHSRSARHDILDLVTVVARMAVPVVLTTRPLEGQILPANLGHRITLGPFSSNSELPTAIEALTVEFIADDSVKPSNPVSAIQTALARGALVDDVCTSPLLLRLLFSLSAPHFPQLELDVTGLYNLFWSRRIVSDHRSGPELPADDSDDLSASAGFLAIAMLALGTPEPPVDVVVRRAAQVAASVDHAYDDVVLRRHVRALTRRGVLVTTDNRARFLHQTFFEFAAAKGLANRGAEGELPRLIARVAQTPDDLFVGAVVEQTLIILGSDLLARPAVRASCQTLIRTGLPYPISIAMTVWAHHPALLELTPDMFSAVADDQLRRYLTTLPLLDSRQFAERARDFGNRLDIIPRGTGTGTFHEILSPHDGSIHPPDSRVPDELTAYQERLVRALQRLEARRGDLERATDEAYRSIRRAAGSEDDDQLGRTLFSISRSAFYRLKAGSSWSAPGRKLCADIDAHGDTIGERFDLTRLQDSYAAAAQEADDARHSRDWHGGSAGQ
ncbi:MULTISPECIES: ATP-binding protein [unclassified Rhodococcus (in: high G+C Gram-positive bacteria)]|uniref:ATP-binding protein n=1 Tax=unclassified Rhodococcus (in: high G+C Gram-positive bacteria) TaxID=192944 RepID=UPI0011404F17|nr:MULTISPECIES: ATP-binding protein [unclassified Rhodococcus (in: high G+C Gram-positive bacteria)]